MNQMVLRESSESHQGLGVFARYGYADESPVGIQHFWSVGGQYRGPIPTRDDDVVGVGWAQAFTANDPMFPAAYEGVVETYYRAQVTPWFFISPMFQYIVNPGSTDTENAVVLSLRGQFVF